MKYPTILKNAKSLLAKHLTKEVFEQLKDKKTSNGFTLHDVIKSGVKNPDSVIGAYAGDEESYLVFAPLFDKIIKDYHGFKTANFHKSNLNPNYLFAPNPDIDNKYIISTRIRVARNVKNIPLGTVITSNQRNQLERQISTVLNTFTGELSGTYYTLNNLSEIERKTLVSNHFFELYA